MSWKRAAVAMLVAIPLLMLFAFGLTRGDPRLIPSPLVGGPAPDFALPVMALDGPVDGRETTGDTVRLSALEGDIVVVNFFASWCVPCRVEHGILTRAARRYEDRGVRFLGVVYNDEPPAVRRYIRQLGGQNYPALLDAGQLVAIDYGLIGVPETFFIDRTGVVQRKVFSAVSASLLQDQLEKMLAEEPPAAGEAGP